MADPKTFRFGDEKLVVSLTRHDDHLTVHIEDRVHGARWGKGDSTAAGASRLVALEIYNKMEDRLERFEKFRVDAVEVSDSAAHVTVSDGFRRIAVGFYLRVEKGELAIVLQPAEVYEHQSQLYRVFFVDFLPGLMQAGPDGELLLPLNTGVLCKPANKPKAADAFLIYGEQSRWELLPTLPLVGVQTPSGGLVSLATRSPAEAQCRVATDGQGRGHVGFAMHLRSTWIDKVEYDLREFRFVPISPKADLSVAAGKRLRRHVMEDHGKPTLRQRVAESPELAYTLDAYIMKLFYGIQRQGIMMYGNDDRGDVRFQNVMTFAEAGKNLQRLHAAGVDKVYTQSVGWNPRGHDGAWPTAFPIDERLGGEAGFRELLALGKRLDYRMTVHDNHNNMYEASPDFDVDVVLHDIHGQPDAKGFWGGGTTFITWVLAVGEEKLRRRMLAVKALGLTGTYYVDAMGNPLYQNYHPRHRGTRSDYARGINLILRLGKELYGSVGTECGFLYNSLIPDVVNTPGAEWHLKLCKPEWPVTQLIDQRRPVWQLAMHGLVVNESHGDNWSSTMTSVLMGDHPRTEWSARPGVMPVLDDAYIARIKAVYDVAIKRFGRHQLMEMTDFRQVTEKVQQTTFEDGTVVVADFAKEELSVNGKQVERPAALTPKK